MKLCSDKKVRGTAFRLDCPDPPFTGGIYFPEFKCEGLPAYAIDMDGEFAIAYGSFSECGLTGGTWTLMKNIVRFNV